MHQYSQCRALDSFLTSQLEYVDGKNAVIDLYMPPKPHLINETFCELTSHDKDLLANFLKLCLSKCHEIHCKLDCDQAIQAMAHTLADDNQHITPLNFEQCNFPTERLLDDQMPRLKTKTIYLRMDKLCSNSVFDAKKFLDLTAK